MLIYNDAQLDFLQCLPQMMAHFAKGVYPCYHCRDDFARIWTRGSPDGEGPAYTTLPVMSTTLPLEDVITVDDANLWLWQVHNAVSIRIYARHANDFKATAVEFAAQ